MPKPHIYFITGASGAGKTTLVSELKAKYGNRNTWAFEHFDSIGVPSTEEMTRQFGSPSDWQKAMTFEWAKRLISNYTDKEIIIFEGQVNLVFIKAAFEACNFFNYTAILIDCQPDVISARLKLRGQPELDNEDMRNWFRFLRDQAIQSATPIIDTSKLTKEQMAEVFEKYLDHNYSQS